MHILIDRAQRNTTYINDKAREPRKPLVLCEIHTYQAFSGHKYLARRVPYHIMVIPRKISGASPVIIVLVIMAFLAVSGVASRRLGGDAAWTAPASRTESISGDAVVQFLRQIYLQQLGAGPSCGTNSSNGGCPRSP